MNEGWIFAALDYIADTYSMGVMQAEESFITLPTMELVAYAFISEGSYGTRRPCKRSTPSTSGSSQRSAFSGSKMTLETMFVQLCVSQGVQPRSLLPHLRYLHTPRVDFLHVRETLDQMLQGYRATKYAESAKDFYP